MEFLRSGELLLRQHSPFLWSFLALSVAPRPALRRGCQIVALPTSLRNHAHRRCLSQTASNAQEAPAAAPQKDSHHSESSTSKGYPESQEQKNARLFDGLLSPTGHPTPTRGPPNPGASPSRAQPGNRSQFGSSHMDVEQAFSSENFKGGFRRSSGIDVSRMADPSTRSSPSKEKEWTTSAGPPLPEKISLPPMRLGPRAGRSVNIDARKNMDVGRAFRQLDTLVSRNRIRSDFAKQRFHERPGLKRKRLKSERWRKRFKVAFKATVARVKELKRKGW
ncbi:hypothetical protein EV356DRAFT_500098 [Viridothelium virens]|uniref:Ribosomal protein S21 n=1 Tax=Viridothelium virens TaxID=1048519 RepID=A0A6A6HDM9_VIRVR|nr:hypothetical protein EV356DRAFT_500098 [Viridothelium virens]